jgi:hypothetical protein
VVFHLPGREKRPKEGIKKSAIDNTGREEGIKYTGRVHRLAPGFHLVGRGEYTLAFPAGYRVPMGIPARSGVMDEEKNKSLFQTFQWKNFPIRPCGRKKSGKKERGAFEKGDVEGR